MSAGPPLVPPIDPMLGRLVRELPEGGYLYEPKWDGFRCLAFRWEDEVELQSRHTRPLGRYFPEVTAALAELEEEGFTLDGELLIERDGGFDFPALMRRLHPAATRVAELARETPATYVAFDLLSAGGEALLETPFEARRSRLEALLAAAPPPLRLTPATDEPKRAAQWLERFHGAGVDGVIAKARDMPYRPGKRTMLKVKHELTADCVVAGIRHVVGAQAVASLLLGLYDEADELVHVGVVSQLREEQRREMARELAALKVSLEEHPWREGYLLAGGPTGRLPGSAGRWTPEMTMDWVPLAPERVVEVAYDQLDDGRFRHPARFRRWRPDRDARSCRTDQLRVEPVAIP